ncbi:hypothetical protein NLM27_23540 [Bradyrhizobium sp. CCGB12]|uniref:hypothetical protein n=1 Tax=Bradyrhizobium sp. CCGB12 TaxID=2949632 RepID=UPI0020B4002B|nr:hypothetical protein [Bradyrhizobium sp. CCGB12]MCP3391769.1 hypothetical protein [Bradyrhizobium sp. CCGB12]
MNGEAGCMICSQARTLKALFPIARDYELKLYECAICGNDLWLVARASKSSVAQVQRGMSRDLPSKKIERAPKRSPGPVAPNLKGPPS